MEDGATGRDLSEAEPLETESTLAVPPVAAWGGRRRHGHARRCRRVDGVDRTFRRRGRASRSVDHQASRPGARRGVRRHADRCGRRRDDVHVQVDAVRRSSRAIAIQDALTEREQADPEATLRVRIGLNVGEVVGHDATPFGAAVNAGARVMSMADGGEVFVSEMVRRLAGTVPGVDYRDRGRHRFKGFDEPWRVYQVLWPGAPAPRPRASSRRSSPRLLVAVAARGGCRRGCSRGRPVARRRDVRRRSARTPWRDWTAAAEASNSRQPSGRGQARARSASTASGSPSRTAASWSASTSRTVPSGTRSRLARRRPGSQSAAGPCGSRTPRTGR